jgi:hypothetical protein
MKLTAFSFLFLYVAAQPKANVPRALNEGLPSREVAANAHAVITRVVEPLAGNAGSSCTSDADCESGCCGFNNGKRVGTPIAFELAGGCGRGEATPSNNCAKAICGPDAEPVKGPK